MENINGMLSTGNNIKVKDHTHISENDSPFRLFLQNRGADSQGLLGLDRSFCSFEFVLISNDFLFEVLIGFFVEVCDVFSLVCFGSVLNFFSCISSR